MSCNDNLDKLQISTPLHDVGHVRGRAGPDPAMASLFHAESLRRGAADVRRSEFE